MDSTDTTFFNFIVNLEYLIVIVSALTFLSLWLGIFIAWDIRRKLEKLHGTDVVVAENTKAIEKLNRTLDSMQQTMSDLRTTVLLNQNTIDNKLANLEKKK